MHGKYSFSEASLMEPAKETSTRETTPVKQIRKRVSSPAVVCRQIPPGAPKKINPYVSRIRRSRVRPLLRVEEALEKTHISVSFPFPFDV